MAEFLGGLSKPFERTLTEQVVRVLRKQIILGHLQPGERLVELQISAQLEVSRSTVREAFRRLDNEGLIEISPHRGTRVAIISPSDGIEICELHALLESDVTCHLHLPIDEETWFRLLGHVDEMAQLTFPDDLDRFIDIDHSFHQTMIESAGRPRFEQVWSNLSSLIGVLVAVLMHYVPLDPARTARRHREIVDALSQPDNVVAARVVRDHYESLGSRIGEALTAQHSEAQLASRGELFGTKGT
jgi:DNA-binding GntR family transcriptional regulator